MYVYQSSFIDFLSVIFFGYMIWLGVSHHLLKQKVKQQQNEIDHLNMKINRLKRSIRKSSVEDEDEEEEYSFMNKNFD